VEERALRAGAAPQLAAALRQPITLDFREATLRQVFEAISRGSGLNFIFDRDARLEARTTIFVRNSSIEDVLRFVLVTTSSSARCYPRTRCSSTPTRRQGARLPGAGGEELLPLQRRRESDGEHDPRAGEDEDLYIDEKLNLLVIRDTVEAVRMAERLIANQDLAERK